jgi:D-alanine-D-alanine ligase
MKKQKINLALVYGGPSSEHEISVKSFNNVYENILNSKLKDSLNLEIIFISKKGEWRVRGNEGKLAKPIFPQTILKNLQKGNFIVWPIMHGEFGEDGEFQKLCEKNKIKCIGSNSKVSKLAMDKFKTQKVLEKNGIVCPKSILIEKGKTNTNKIILVKDKFTFPIIFKPVDLGSSVGLVKVDKKENFEKELNKYFSKFEKVLIQEFVTGREFTCGVLENKNKLIRLDATEIVLKNSKTFDYKTKYTADACQEVTPANVNKKVMKNLQEIAEKVHKLIGCKDYSRTDMIMRDTGEVVVLEINTLPGLTKTSFIPQQLQVKNITIPKFIDIIIKNNL